MPDSDAAAAPPTRRALFQRILVATDGSPGSRSAARYGAGLAERFGAEVIVVHAVAMPSAYSLGVYPPAKEVEDVLAAHARDAVAVVTGVLDAHGLDHSEVVEHGSAAEVVLEAADARDADLIVVGSRGLGGVSRFLLGSVSSRILHHAQCAVLVAPAPDDEGS